MAVTYEKGDILEEKVMLFENKIACLGNELTQYEYRLFYGGLQDCEIQDLNNILNILKECMKDLNWFDPFDSRIILYSKEIIPDLEKRFMRIKKELLNIEKINNYGCYETVYEFVNSSSDISHLVFTNNMSSKIHHSSGNNSSFICQFHGEVSPSLKVFHQDNVFRCFGCGATGNAVTYIKLYEGLNTGQALQVLARIYCLDIPINRYSEDDEIVQKYQSALLSDEYREFLNDKKARYINANLSETEKELISISMNHTYETIDRVRNNVHKKYKNKRVKSKNKRLVLAIPDFEQEKTDY